MGFQEFSMNIRRQCKWLESGKQSRAPMGFSDILSGKLNYGWSNRVTDKAISWQKGIVWHWGPVQKILGSRARHNYSIIMERQQLSRSEEDWTELIEPQAADNDYGFNYPEMELTNAPQQKSKQTYVYVFFFQFFSFLLLFGLFSGVKYAEMHFYGLTYTQVKHHKSCQSQPAKLACERM